MPKRPRPKMIGFYVSADEREMIERGAADYGMSVSGYLRFLARRADRENRQIQGLPKPIKKEVAEYAQ